MRRTEVRTAVLEQVGRWLSDALCDPPAMEYGEKVSMSMELNVFEDEWTLNVSSSRTVEVIPPKEEEE